VIIAPRGFNALMRGIEYYLLAHAPRGAVLTWFTEQASRRASDRWRADIIRIPTAAFEAAVVEGAIVVKEADRAFPPWLSELEGMNPDALEELRVSKKISYRDAATRRYGQIAGLAENDDELYSADDIYSTISAHAAACKPRQRSDRIRLWFCAYKAFGEDLYSLTPAYLGNGKWDRQKLADPTKKLGRPNLKNGVNSGHSAILLRGLIAELYLKHSDLGKPMTDIYSDALAYSLGCKVVKDSRGNLSYYHPEGAAFPTLNQFCYHAKAHFGLETIQRRKFGDARYRSRLARSNGKFSQATANVLETTEADVYYLQERPKQLLSDQPGLPLAVCRIACQATGDITGVGFSYGAEREEAYKGALFFSAVRKDLLARMFGVEISDEDFPCTGLTRKLITDRGPGHNTGGKVLEGDQPPIRGMAPSWSGQSKSTVESSHPRDVQIEGAPSYVQSDLTVYELAKREILLAASDNRTSDASKRLTPEMIMANTPPNPNGMVNFLSSRGRVDGKTISLDRAVRNFLRKVEFDLDVEGLHLYGLLYDSEDFHRCAIAKQPQGKQRLQIEGYVLPLCVRIEWVEWKGKLIEVGAQLPIRDDPHQLNISLAELKQVEAKRNQLNKEQREHAAAAKLDARNRFTDATGKQWSAGERKSGKPPAKVAQGGSAMHVPTQASAGRKAK
jgi:hypothetical protein